MSTRCPYLLALPAAVALFLAGCGGGQSSSSATAAQTGPLTKAEFIKKADEVCRKADVTQTNEGRRYRRVHAKELAKLAPIPREEKLIVAIILPSIRQQMRAMGALDAPKGEKEKIQSFVAGIEAGLKKAKKHPYSVEPEVPSQNPFLSVNEAMIRYGFAYCSDMA